MTELSMQQQQEKVAVSFKVLIVVLLVANIAVGALTVRKITAKEPTVELEVARLKNSMEQVNKNPSDVNARLQLAYALQSMKEYKRAREQYVEVLKIEENNLAANYNLGVIAQEEKKYAEGEKYYKKVLKLKANHVIAAIGLGEIYLMQEKYSEVIKVADDVLKLEPGKTDLYLLKAQAYEKMGDKTKAKEQYQEVLKYVPDDTEALAGLEKLK